MFCYFPSFPAICCFVCGLGVRHVYEYLSTLTPSNTEVRQNMLMQSFHSLPSKPGDNGVVDLFYPLKRLTIAFKHQEQKVVRFWRRCETSHTSGEFASPPSHTTRHTGARATPCTRLQFPYVDLVTKSGDCSSVFNFLSISVFSSLFATIYPQHLP